MAHQAAGYTAFKYRPGGAFERFATIQDYIPYVRELRKAVGPDFDLMQESNQRWSVEQCLEIAPVLEEAKILWWEEPTRKNIDDYLTIKKALKRVKISGGETEMCIRDSPGGEIDDVAAGDGVVGVIGRCEDRVEVGDGTEGGLVLEAIDARAGDQREVENLVIGPAARGAPAGDIGDGAAAGDVFEQNAEEARRDGGERGGTLGRLAAGQGGNETEGLAVVARLESCLLYTSRCV